MKYRSGLLLVTLLGSQAMAQVASPDIPVLAPNCVNTILVPDNSAGYYFNETCNKVFVLPDLIGKVTTSDISEVANQDMCKGLRSALNSENILAARIEKNDKAIGALPPESPVLDQLLEENDKLRNEIPKLYENYDDVLGGYAQITFSLSSEAERIKDFANLNLPTIIAKQINIGTAPVSEAYLSFLAHAPGNDEIRRRSVLSHNIPGVGQPNANGVSAIANVRMNGAISGQLVLSLMGACAKQWYPDWTPSTLSQMLVANLTYTVPLESMAGYDAELHSDIAIRNLMEFWQSRTQFDISESSQRASTGSAGSAMTFKMKAYEMPKAFADQTVQFMSQIQDQVQQRLTARLVDQMASAGFVEINTPPAPVQAPAPGFIDEVHSGSQCHSDGPFGIFGSSCSNYTYVVKIPHGSTADSVVKKILDLNFVNRESMEFRGTVTRVYTTTFTPTGNKDLTEKGI